MCLHLNSYGRVLGPTYYNVNGVGALKTPIIWVLGPLRSLMVVRHSTSLIPRTLVAFAACFAAKVNSYSEQLAAEP